jgi:hypothetical protein
MKYTTECTFVRLEKATRRTLKTANMIEAIQNGRISRRSNSAVLCGRRQPGQLAIEPGGLAMQRPGLT